jgi:putative ABC transport system permease protein
MLKNYLKVAFRTLRRNKGYTAINVGGLAVGLAVCLAIALYIQHERSFDRFHTNAERLYRITKTDTTEGEVEVGTPTTHPAPLGPALEDALPDVAETVRFSTRNIPLLVRRGDRSFYEDGILYADSSFFEVFSFELLQGGPQTALARPYTVVLSQSMAQKYFGDENPVGQTLHIRQEDRALEVTGVVEDAPATSSIQYDLIASFATLYAEQKHMMEEYNGGWQMYAFPTYVLLRPRAEANAVGAKLADVLETRATASERFRKGLDHTRYALEPLTDVHLRSAAGNQLGPVSDVRYVWVFGAIALLVLAVASINYMNLATARATRRAKEVGVRKTAGATRRQLAGQFVGESLLVCLAAAVLALLVVRVGLPFVGPLTGVALEAGALTERPFLLGLAGAVLAVGLVSGSYPALVLSRFGAAEVMSGGGATGGKSGQRFRQGLVVFQFAVAVALLAGAAVVWQQLGYIQTKRLGLDEERVLVIPNRGALDEGEVQSLKGELRRRAGVEAVTSGSALPTEGTAGYSTALKGEPESGPMVNLWRTSDGYLETLGMEMAAGRRFQAERGTDRDSAIIINEATAREIGWQDPIGKKLGFGGNDPRTVVGVVEDFHYESLHKEIAPLAMTPVTRDWHHSYVVARVRSSDLSRMLGSVRETWSQFTTAYPLDSFFLDGAFDQLYEAERRIARLFTVFFGLTIVVALLGLFGLAAYTVEARRKEIAVRKVLGASAGGLVALLSKRFALLVAGAFALGAPLAWLGTRRWLESFVYRIDLGVGPFLLAGAAVLVVALVTVGLQALRAARANPAQALRDE